MRQVTCTQGSEVALTNRYRTAAQRGLQRPIPSHRFFYGESINTDAQNMAIHLGKRIAVISFQLFIASSDTKHVTLTRFSVKQEKEAEKRGQNINIQDWHLYFQSNYSRALKRRIFVLEIK